MDQVYAALDGTGVATVDLRPDLLAARRCGVDADEEDDGFVVRPDPAALRGARIETYDDHRMAMSFAVLGLRVPGMTILDPSCVSKTYPRFFEALDALR